MNFRSLLIMLPLLACSSAFAQDKIFKSNGRVMDVKIKKTGSGTITYSRSNSRDGREYIISKRDVDKIRYQDGSEDQFGPDDMGNINASEFRHGEKYIENEAPPRNAHTMRRENYADKMKLRPSVVAFAPIQFTESGVTGFSLSYERAIDKDNYIAFYIPAILEFNTGDDDLYSTSTNYNSDPMFYLMPGLKIYPTSGWGLFKYAIGPSLVIATGQKTSYPHDWIPYSSYYQPPVTQNHFLLGMMVNQSININPTPKLYLGSEFGFGFSYINALGGVNQGLGGLVQFNFKIGYRF